MQGVILPRPGGRFLPSLPEPFWAREAWYRELGIPPDTIQPLSVSRYAQMFEALVKNERVNPTLAAVVIIQFPKRLRKKGLDAKTLDEQVMREILLAHKNGRLTREGILIAMELAMREGGFTGKPLPAPKPEAELMVHMKSADAALAKADTADRDQIRQWLMGLVMNKLRGRVPGRPDAGNVGPGFMRPRGRPYPLRRASDRRH